MWGPHPRVAFFRWPARFGCVSEEHMAGQLAFRIKIVNPGDLELLIEMGEAAESLAEDLPWRDEPKQIIEAIERLIESIDVEPVGG